MTPNRIELSGRLVAEPELRVTPAGTPILQITVECGEASEPLALAVVMAGEEGRVAQAGLRRGSEVEVTGKLRTIAARGPGRSGFEVVATKIVGRG